MAMAKRDLYEVLGLPREASPQQVKSAYRKLAIQYHPDKNPGDQRAEERFKEAAEAYAVLSDPDKRARYDRYGHEAAAGGFSGFDPSVFGDFGDILGDLFGFGDLFGGRRGGRRPAVGSDLRYDLILTFEQAAFGVERELVIPRLERCDSCSGSGSADGRRTPCAQCGGSGQVFFRQGFLTVGRTCARCSGAGSTIAAPCGDCRGAGQVERQRKLEVSVPAGVDTGARLRLVGEGEHGRHGGPPGDLYIFLEVEPHAVLRRDGADVRSEVVVSYPQAVLGATLEVETVHGPAELRIPPAAQPGRELRLKGKGVPRVGGSGRGDHIATVRLVVPSPEELEPRAVEILEELAELGGDDIREHRTVLERVKEIFS
jgi:molecular chaperone DnaJ